MIKDSKSIELEEGVRLLNSEKLKLSEDLTIQ